MSDNETFQNAIRSFFQTIKSPRYWAKVVSLSGVNIDRPAAALLQYLYSADAKTCHVQGLAEYLSVEAPSITRKSQSLETAGLIRRLHDPADRRAVMLEITPAGEKVAKRIKQAQREIISAAFKDWAEQDRQKFSQLFERFCSDFINQSKNI